MGRHRDEKWDETMLRLTAGTAAPLCKLNATEADA